jgi:hypothetical protein
MALVSVVLASAREGLPQRFFCQHAPPSVELVKAPNLRPQYLTDRFPLPQHLQRGLDLRASRPSSMWRELASNQPENLFLEVAGIVAYLLGEVTPETIGKIMGDGLQALHWFRGAL